MTKRWQKEEDRVAEPLMVGVWYRTLLSPDDHCLGRDKVWIEDGTAWCGYPLEGARDWENAEFGGLWFSHRKNAGCSRCKSKEKEYAS